MTRPAGHAFRWTLTLTLGVFGFLTVGAVVLFGHLLFRTLSKDVMDDALVDSKLDAERIARGVAERSGGDLYTLKTKQTEIDSFIGGALSERKVLAEIQVLDKEGRLVYLFKSSLQRPERGGGASAEGERVVPVPPGQNLQPLPRSVETSMPIGDPFNFEVPIADFGTLHVGVSRKELEARVDSLRRKLYLRTLVAAAVSLLGIVAGSLAVALLIQRLRRTDEARAEAERKAELGEVAAGLAHEIRNPLNAMGLNLELLEEQLARASRAGDNGRAGAAELALAARQESTRLSRLLTDFLAYARPSPLSLVLSDLNEPASEAVAFLLPEAERRGIRLEFRPNPAPAACRLDPARVKQVVLNLVANALDAVESEGAQSREVDVTVADSGEAWRLTVTDQGPGVHPTKLSEVFKVFVSTKPAGTGLGLPIAARIVREHGGTLELLSRPGEPTRVEATFPKA